MFERFGYLLDGDLHTALPLFLSDLPGYRIFFVCIDSSRGDHFRSHGGHSAELLRLSNANAHWIGDGFWIDAKNVELSYAASIPGFSAVYIVEEDFIGIEGEEFSVPFYESDVLADPGFIPICPDGLRRSLCSSKARAYLFDGQGLTYYFRDEPLYRSFERLVLSKKVEAE